MVAKYSAAESGGDSGSDGVEIVKNEPFENDFGRGQYTFKIYHLASKLPSWLVSLIPKNALTLEEEAWNAYPRCVTGPSHSKYLPLTFAELKRNAPGLLRESDAD